MIRTFVLFWLFLLTTTVCAAEDDKHPVRLGDLEITATAAGSVSPQFAGTILAAPREGNHFVLVSVKVKNAGAYRSCTEFDPILQGDSGQEQYTPSLGRGLSWPETFGLPPFQESEGNYLFEVKDGTKPVALTLVRHRNTENLCAMVEERPVFAPENEKVRIDLEGLPNPDSRPDRPR